MEYLPLEAKTSYQSKDDQEKKTYLALECLANVRPIAKLACSSFSPQRYVT